MAGTQVTSVDEYVDALLQEGEREFTRTDFAQWAGITPREASTRLQVHFASPSSRRHNIGCEGHGRAAVWYVAQPRNAQRMGRYAVARYSKSMITDFVRRARPTAARSSSKKVKAAMKYAEEQLALELRKLVATVDYAMRDDNDDNGSV